LLARTDDLSSARNAGAGVYALAALSAAAGAACYANALPGAFVFDDVKLIVNNEALRAAATWRSLFLSDLWGAAGLDTGYYRPLAAATFRALYAAFGHRPEVFHAVNVLLHAATTALVFLLVRSVLSADHREGAGDGPALGSALLFAVHPVHVEAVAWASGLMDVAAGFFSVLFLVLYVRGARVASWIALLAGLLFKESAIAALPVAILYDLIVLRGPERSIGIRLRRWSGMLVVAGGYLILRRAALGYLLVPPGAAEGAVLRGAAGAVVLVATYVQKLIVPHPLNAVADVRVPASMLTLDALRIAVVLAVLGGLIVVAARRRRVTLFALALVVIPLLPALAVAPIDPAIELAFAERYLYFPSVGLSLLVGDGLATLAADGRSRLRLAGWAALAAVIVAFAALTVARNRVWHDELSLWSDTARKTPNVARVRASLGLALYRHGRAAPAREEFAEALRLQPDLPRRYVDSGVRAAQRGQILMGILDVQSALLIDPSYVDAQFNLAVIYQNGGWAEMAMASYAKVLALQPEHEAAHVNLGVLLAESGRVSEAIPHLEEAVRIDPDDAEARHDLERARRLGGTRD
jgi:tetratricopeptide (TPR) repeat protein